MLHLLSPFLPTFRPRSWNTETGLARGVRGKQFSECFTYHYPHPLTCAWNAAEVWNIWNKILEVYSKATVKGGERKENNAASGKTSSILDRQNTLDLQSPRYVNWTLQVVLLHLKHILRACGIGSQFRLWD